MTRDDRGGGDNLKDGSGNSQPAPAPVPLAYRTADAPPEPPRYKYRKGEHRERGKMVVLAIVGLGVVLGIIGWLYRAPSPAQKKKSQEQQQQQDAPAGDAGADLTPSGEKAADPAEQG